MELETYGNQVSWFAWAVLFGARGRLKKEFGNEYVQYERKNMFIPFGHQRDDFRKSSKLGQVE